MNSQDRISKYINSVCKEIRNKEAHERVADELKNHILDIRDYYIQQGLSEEEATTRAIEQTGKAMPLGEQFDKVHLPNPKWAMRPTLLLKTLLRTPVRTLVAFLLVAVASFALFSRVVEYTIVAREMDRASAAYRGVLFLDNGIPDTSMIIFGGVFADNDLFRYTPPPVLTVEQIEAFKSLRYVSSAETRYMTSGVSKDGYARVNLDGGYEELFNYTNRFIFEGDYHIPVQQHEFDNAIRLSFIRGHLLAGDPLVTLADSRITASQLRDSRFMSPAERLLYDSFDNPFAGEYFLDTLNDGERYLLVGRWVPQQVLHRTSIGDRATMHFWPAVTSLDGKPENYLETDEFAPVRLLIEITDTDRYTFDMVYTSDMMSIPRFDSQEMIIYDGRALTSADAGTANAVINRTVAGRYNLRVGDTITMGLGSKLLYQNSTLGAVAVTPERYSPPDNIKELTIVGIWSDTDTVLDRLGNVHLGYSRNTIFVPSTLLPVDVPDTHAYYPGEYSFVVGDARDIAAFLEIAEPLAEELGIRLGFNDGGWLRIEEALEATQRLSLVSVGLFILAAAAALLLSVFIFMSRNDKVYAIMRALGASRSISRIALLLPFGVLSVLATPVGAVTGLVFTSRSIAPVLDNMMDTIPGYIPDSSLSTQAVIIIALAMLFFLLTASIIYIHSMSRTSPLTLLQGGKGKRKAIKKQLRLQETDLSGGAVPTINMDTPLSLPPERKHNVTQCNAVQRNTTQRNAAQFSAASHVLRNAMRSMRRTAWKTALSVVLTILFCGAMGLLVFTRLTYEDLFDNFEIKGFMTDPASDVLVDAVHSELLDDVYYRDAFYVRVPLGSDMLFDFTEPGSLVVTNDVLRYLEDKNISDYEITFYDGFYGPLQEPGLGTTPAVIGAELARSLGTELGGRVTACTAFALEHHEWFMEYWYPDGHPEDSIFREERLADISSIFEVVGILECDVYATSLFVPVGVRTSNILFYDPVIMFMSRTFTLGYAEFTVADRNRLDEAIELAAQFETRSRRLSPNAAVLIDIAELDNMRDILDLVDVLFPFAVAAAVLIGMLAPCLLLLQSTKNAAVMRIQGTTRLRAFAVLSLEQVLLCIVGLVITAIALLIYDIDLLMRSYRMLALCFGLYLGGYTLSVIITSTIITRHKILRLLQAKE